jgi:hypothetical protein
MARLGQAVRQLTYEPKDAAGNQVRRLFNLTEITITTGPIRVGIEYADGRIGVYENLSAGTWPLPEANNIDRVTLECPTDPNTGLIVECRTSDAISARVASLQLEPLDEPAVSARFVAVGDTGVAPPLPGQQPNPDQVRQKQVRDALEWLTENELSDSNPLWHDGCD